MDSNLVIAPCVGKALYTWPLVRTTIVAHSGCSFVRFDLESAHYDSGRSAGVIGGTRVSGYDSDIATFRSNIRGQGWNQNGDAL